MSLPQEFVRLLGAIIMLLSGQVKFVGYQLQTRCVHLARSQSQHVQVQWSRGLYWSWLIGWKDDHDHTVTCIRLHNKAMACYASLPCSARLYEPVCDKRPNRRRCVAEMHVQTPNAVRSDTIDGTHRTPCSPASRPNAPNQCTADECRRPSWF